MTSDPSSPDSRAIPIAVFGSSEPRFGEPGFALAHELGRLLGAAGYSVVTGGYGGVMEAASRGARESGGDAIGVTCRIFDHREPNPYLSEAVHSVDLHDRTRELIDRASGFVVLPGKAGTLAELSFLWALHRAGCLDQRPVVLLGRRWNEFLRYLRNSRMLDAAQLEVTHPVATPGEVLGVLRRQLPPPTAPTPRPEG